jgi:retron-type reverse transcriptase
MIADILAEAMVTGPWDPFRMTERCVAALTVDWPDIQELTKRILVEFGTFARPPKRRVTAFITQQEVFRNAFRNLFALKGKSNKTNHLEVFLSPRIDREPVMWPASGFPGDSRILAITDLQSLARTLQLSQDALIWLADVLNRERKTQQGRYRHYEYRWVKKRNGHSRLIEVPQRNLRFAQRALLDKVISQIPVHDAAHAFRPGRSIKTFALPHCSQQIVLKLDLKDFFPTITSSRVTALFRTVGYPEDVARLMSGLSTNSTPTRPLKHEAGLTHETYRLYRQPHLPQGAPTSPALANLVAFHLDRRLTALAKHWDANYTRYADDLTFSGGPRLKSVIKKFVIWAMTIALEEGFVTNGHKTRVMRASIRQKVAGTVVNAHPNITRTDFDALKATLHNSVKLGPGSQNRDDHPNFRAHLLGKISHVHMLNPARAQKLQTIFEQIVWS